EPYQIAGIGIQPAQPPPDLAPPKMTESQAQQFTRWVRCRYDRSRLREIVVYTLSNALSFGLTHVPTKIGSAPIRRQRCDRTVRKTSANHGEPASGFPAFWRKS